MIERAFLIFWAFWLLLILVAAFRVLGFLIARRRQDKRWGDGSRNQQPAAVIVAVKGFDIKSTPRFFDTLFAQDYSEYRVIVCFESWEDPVAQWLRDELEVSDANPVWTHPDSESGLRSITLVQAGVSTDEGQKVHNQRAGFEHLEPNDKVIAFADADISFDKTWLKRLVAPINQETHTLSTTYRWLVPKRPTLPNQIASVINGSITTQGGSELTNVLWGGSMAIRRSAFDELDVSNLFAGALNDDLRLSKAARKAKNRIAFVRSLVVPTSIDYTWGSFFEFAKRQYTQVRFFSPILYRCVNFLLGFYALGLLSIIGALIYGYFFAWIPIAAAYVIDQFRALLRQQVYLSLFPEDKIRRKLFSASWLEHMLTPFWMMIHWLIVVSTWTQNTITWAGIRYRILSSSKTRILERSTPELTLPVGVPGLALLSSLADRKRGTYTQPVRPVRTGLTEPIRPGRAAAIEETSAPSEELVPAAVHETPAPPAAEEVAAVSEEPAATAAPDKPDVSDVVPAGARPPVVAASASLPLSGSSAIRALSSPPPWRKVLVRRHPVPQAAQRPHPSGPPLTKRNAPELVESSFGFKPKTRLEQLP